jgi:two-component system LytT family sensor kinase
MKTDILQWSRGKKWLAILSVYLLIGLWQTGIYVADNLANGEPARLGIILFEEIIAAMCAFSLVPALLAFFRRVPFKRGAILRKLPLYLLVWLGYGVMLTILLYSSRTVAFKVFDLGTYHYGAILPRMAMETIKQFFVFWIIYFIRLFFITLYESEQERLRALSLQQQLTKARLQTLQMQLNPHFLFNTLNVISSTMYDDVKTADKMIANLSDLLRRTLDGVNWEEHPLRKELELLALYGDTMKQRFREKLALRTDIAPETLDALIPGFILQPLVENSIQYCMDRSKTAAVDIVARRSDNELLITVSDDGPGIDEDLDKVTKSGIGLSNIIERLDTLYGNAQKLEIQNLQQGGLKVTMHIPFHLTPVRIQDADKR